MKEREVGEDDEGVKLLGYLRRLYPRLPRGLLEKGMRKGWVRVGGGRVRGDRVLKKGERVKLPHFFEEGGGRDDYQGTARDREYLRSLEITRSDRYVYFDKPEGLAVQGGSGLNRHVDGMLKGYLGGEEEGRLIHRLDKGTSGILAVARTRRAAEEAGRGFSGREVKKLYWALVMGVMTERVGETGYDMRTRYSVEWEDSERGLSVVALRPLTGKKHQLRVHMSELCGMVVGDDRYGDGESRERGRVLGLGGDRLMLHSGMLGLKGEEVVTSVLPNDFCVVMEKVGCGEVRCWEEVWKDIGG